MERHLGNASTEKSARPNRTEYHSALPIGSFIGRYKITSVLGEGGFGITYLCHDTQLHRDVAIKEYLPSTLAIRQGDTEVLPRSTAVSSDFVWGRNRFLDEARTLAKLSNIPGVVRVHDFLEAHGTAYVVMQLLVGETLAECLIRETRLSQSRIEKMLVPLLDGLEQIHAVGFLHRDIKPANIMLASDGSPTLIDFGASRAAIADRSQVMTAIFTPGFAAPEQASIGKQGPWTDIYGLAATLYACACGKPPQSALDRLLDDTGTSAFDADPQGYSASFKSAIDAGLLLQAHTRPQSIAQWREVFATGAWHSGDKTQHKLESPAPAQTSAASPAVDPQIARNAPSSRHIQRLSLIVLLIVSAAVASYFIIVPSEKPREGGTAQVVVPSPVAESRQPAAEVKQPPSDVKQPPSDVKQATSDVKQPASDVKQATSDVKQPASDVKQPATDAKQPAADVKQPPSAGQADAQPAIQRPREAETPRRTEEDTAVATGQRDLLNAAIKQVSEGEAFANAEPDEVRLRLTVRDRKRVQVALGSLGFDVGTVDGIFGPRSRQMIAAWQGKRGEPATGFLTAKQKESLEGEGAAALAKWEDAQRRLVADEQRRQQQQPVAPPPPPPQQRRSGWRWPWE